MPARTHAARQRNIKTGCTDKRDDTEVVESKVAGLDEPILRLGGPRCAL
jgi:hypothetical protein